MKKLLSIILLFSFLKGISQVTIVNNTNLYGFTHTITSGFSSRTNINNGVDLEGFPGTSTCRLDTVLNLSCYDSLRVSFTSWKMQFGPPVPGNSVMGIAITTVPATYTVTTYNTNTLSITFTIATFINPNTRIEIKDLKVIGYQSVISCTAPPAQPVAIAGPTFICPGSVHLYSVTPVCGVSNYSWTLPGGWSGTSTTNIITTTAGVASGNLSVTAITGCGTSPVQTLSVTVDNTPPLAQPSAIAGPNPVCIGLTANYSVSPVPGATSYSWTLPPSWNGLSNTNNINAYVVSNGTISVWAINYCYVSQPQILNVTVSPLPNLTVSPQTTICAGSSITLTASGANTYTWSNGPLTPSVIVNPTVSTTYTIAGTDLAGCTNTIAQTQSVAALPNIFIIGNNTVCLGSSLNLTGWGANSYTWSNGPQTSTILVTPTVNSTYTVTGTSVAGCTNTSATSITVNPIPTVSAVSSDSLICVGETVTLTASGALSYSWSNNASGNSITVSPSATIVYTVTGTSNGCSNSAVVTQSVDLCTSLGQVQNKNKIFNIAPNPFYNNIVVNGVKGMTITILGIDGSTVYFQQSETESETISLSNLSAGIYFIEIGCGSDLFVRKIIKE